MTTVAKTYKERIGQLKDWLAKRAQGGLVRAVPAEDENSDVPRQADLDVASFNHGDELPDLSFADALDTVTAPNITDREEEVAVGGALERAHRLVAEGRRWLQRVSRQIASSGGATTELKGGDALYTQLADFFESGKHPLLLPEEGFATAFEASFLRDADLLLAAINDQTDLARDYRSLLKTAFQAPKDSEFLSNVVYIWLLPFTHEQLKVIEQLLRKHPVHAATFKKSFSGTQPGDIRWGIYVGQTVNWGAHRLEQTLVKARLDAANRDKRPGTFSSFMLSVFFEGEDYIARSRIDKKHHERCTVMALAQSEDAETLDVLEISFIRTLANMNSDTGGKSERYRGTGPLKDLLEGVADMSEHIIIIGDSPPTKDLAASDAKLRVVLSRLVRKAGGGGYATLRILNAWPKDKSNDHVNQLAYGDVDPMHKNSAKRLNKVLRGTQTFGMHCWGRQTLAATFKHLKSEHGIDLQTISGKKWADWEDGMMVSFDAPVRKGKKAKRMTLAYTIHPRHVAYSVPEAKAPTWAIIWQTMAMLQGAVNLNKTQYESEVDA